MNRAYINKADPTQAEWIIKRFNAKIKLYLESIVPEIEKLFEGPPAGTPGLMHAASSIGTIDLKDLLGGVDGILRKVYYDSEGTLQDTIEKAYSQGDMFAQISLGAKPEVRRATWSLIGDRVLKSQSDFKGITDYTASKIRTTIADGIINERTQGDMIAEIMETIDKVTYARAETMVRTESMKAVNAGVKDRYDQEGVDGFERLEAEDEKTCTDWEFNIDGVIYMGCAGIDGKVFTKDQADQVDEQTHPNCRGTWVPSISIPEMEA